MRKGWFSNFLQLSNEMPSHDAITGVFTVLGSPVQKYLLKLYTKFLEDMRGMNKFASMVFVIVANVFGNKNSLLSTIVNKAPGLFSEINESVSTKTITAVLAEQDKVSEKFFLKKTSIPKAPQSLICDANKENKSFFIFSSANIQPLFSPIKQFYSTKSTKNSNISENKSDIAKSKKLIRESDDSPNSREQIATLSAKAVVANLLEEGYELFAITTILSDIGMSCAHSGETKKALEYLEQALKIDIKSYGEDHPNVASDVNNIGVIYLYSGDAKKALKYLEQALKIDIKSHGMVHPDVAVSLNNVGNAYQDFGDAKKALGCFRQALKIYRKLCKEGHSEVIQNLNNIGMLYIHLGKAKKALKYLEQALKIDIKLHGENHPSTATRLNNIGIAYIHLGETRKALECLEQALKISTKFYGDDHPNVARGFNNIGSVYQSLDEPKKALKYFEQAVKIARKKLDNNHPDMVLCLQNLENCKKALSKKDVFPLANSSVLLFGSENEKNKAILNSQEIHINTKATPSKK